MRIRLQQTRFRAAIGLIAAYAIALETLFAAFAPLPASAAGFDFGQVVCFGSGATDRSDPSAPVPASGKFHCVLCGSVLGSAAVMPEPVAVPHRHASRCEALPPSAPGMLIPARWSCVGPARAPPLTV